MTVQKIIVSGVLLIDKPQGMTSQQVVSKVKYLLKSPAHDSKKAGHTGTLDPMATGLLPICLGEATKFSQYQLDAIKSYQAVIKLGEQTDTGDAEGQVVATASIPNFSQADLDPVKEQFLGEISQIPPMYSALKKDGKKLYELAREGIEIEREARKLTIFELQIRPLSVNELQIQVTCSKGTYVRVLGEDIAKALGTLGHLTALRRTKTGDFDIENAISLADFEALSFENRLAKLLPVDECVKFLPRLILDENQSQRIGQGQRLNVKLQADSQNLLTNFDETKVDKTSFDKKASQEVRLFDANQHFLGVASLECNGRLQPIKLVNL